LAFALILKKMKNQKVKKKKKKIKKSANKIINEKKMK